MGNVKRREKTLFFLFLKQVIGIAAAVMLEVVTFVVLFYAGLNTGVILPANYVESYLLSIEDELVSSRTFSKELLPEACEYALFDSEGKYLEGNSEDIDKLRKCLAGKRLQNDYKIVVREDGYCVICYSIRAHFSNAALHKWIPYLEATIIVLFAIIFLLIITINALCFGRKLRRKLTPLLEEILHIKERDLVFAAGYSDIREFNEILLSLNDMKEALANSLKKEWATEQRRKENISALAHDIKTPLTIIKGNVELLREETEIEEIYACADTINENTDKIEHYIRLLIEETNGVDVVIEEIDLPELIKGIKEQSGVLCNTEQLPLVIKENWSKQNKGKIEGAERIQRAVLNIVANALEHTDRKKGIQLTFEEDEGLVCIRVEDYGNGFSEEALLHATEQFFTEKKERSGAHYGLGLHFAEKVAKEHGGRLCIRNKKQEKGAEVTLCFKC